MTTPDPLANPPDPESTQPAAPPPSPAPVPAAPAGPPPPSPAPVSTAPAGAPPVAPPSPERPAPTGQQAGLVIGVILVVVGAVFLVGRVVDVSLGEDAWPLWIVVPGLVMLFGSLAIPPRNGLGLAIPGGIVTMVGLVLWVQETYDLYATWAYAWALVAPTGPGIGMLLYGLARGDREIARDGLRTTLVGLGLFFGFALFFEGVIGLSGGRIAGLDDALPYAAIGLGVLLVVLSLFGRREKTGSA
jgi:hypothetical protein